MFRVILGGRAQADVEHIYEWMRARSIRGAARWYDAFLVAASELRLDPGRHPLAVDCQPFGEEIRETFFRTPRGRTYRLLFLIRAPEVRILRVRGPGQAPLSSRDV